MKAVIFGAGSIGRGFIGDLLNRSNYKLVFVDVDKDLLTSMNTAGSYTLELLEGGNKQTLQIPVHKAIDGNDIEAVASEISDCHIIFTAVGVNALKYIMPALAKGVLKRETSINVILCENMIDAHELAHDLLAEHLNVNELAKVGFIRASVSRMVPLPIKGSDPLVVHAEPYAHLPIDSEGIVDDLPKFEGLELVSPFTYAIERKLYIHNLGHVTCGWLGAIKGCEYIWQAMDDEEIKKSVELAMKQSAVALAKRYNILMADLDAHIKDLLYRFSNKALGDTAPRVGRDSLRKLSYNDRVVGALNMCFDYDLPCDAIQKTLVAGLLFQSEDAGTIQIQTMIKETGIKHVLTDICKISDVDLIDGIAEQYNEMKI